MPAPPPALAFVPPEPLAAMPPVPDCAGLALPAEPALPPEQFTHWHSIALRSDRDVSPVHAHNAHAAAQVSHTFASRNLNQVCARIEPHQRCARAKYLGGRCRDLQKRAVDLWRDGMTNAPQ